MRTQFGPSGSILYSVPSLGWSPHPGVWQRFVHFGAISATALPAPVRTCDQMVIITNLVAKIRNHLMISSKPARPYEAPVAVIRELFPGIGMRSEKTTTG